VDWWQSLPFEWQFVISILIMVGLAILTAVTLGAATPLMTSYAVFLAGFAFGVAVVAVGIHTGRITDRQQAMDTFFTASMVGELAVGAGMAAARGAMWVGKALARRAEKAVAGAADGASGSGRVWRLRWDEAGGNVPDVSDAAILNRRASQFAVRDKGGYLVKFPRNTVDHMVERGHFEQLARKFHITQEEVFDLIADTISNNLPVKRGGLLIYASEGLRVSVKPVRSGWGLMWNAFPG